MTPPNNRRVRVLTPRLWYVITCVGLLGLGLLLGLAPGSVPADGLSGTSVSCGSPWFPGTPASDRLLLPPGGVVADECHRRGSGQAVAAAVFALAGLLGLLALMFDNMLRDRHPRTTRN